MAQRPREYGQKIIIERERGKVLLKIQLHPRADDQGCKYGEAKEGHIQPGSPPSWRDNVNRNRLVIVGCGRIWGNRIRHSGGPYCKRSISRSGTREAHSGQGAAAASINRSTATPYRA